MSQDLMREAFEAWANNYPALEDDHGYVNLRYLGLHKQYVDFDVQRAWQAYQAGHASAAQAPAAEPMTAKNAARYEALRGTLGVQSFTYAPRITDPMNEWLTYTPEGLDKVCDAMVAAQAPTAKEQP